MYGSATICGSAAALGTASGALALVPPPLGSAACGSGACSGLGSAALGSALSVLDVPLTARHVGQDGLVHVFLPKMGGAAADASSAPSPGVPAPWWHPVWARSDLEEERAAPPELSGRGGSSSSCPPPAPPPACEPPRAKAVDASAAAAVAGFAMPLSEPVQTGETSMSFEHLEHEAEFGVDPAPLPGPLAHVMAEDAAAARDMMPATSWEDAPRQRIGTDASSTLRQQMSTTEERWGLRKRTGTEASSHRQRIGTGTSSLQTMQTEVLAEAAATALSLFRKANQERGGGEPSQRFS